MMRHIGSFQLRPRRSANISRQRASIGRDWTGTPLAYFGLPMRRWSTLCAAFALIAAACSTGPESRSIELTFEGDECSYVGPTRLTPGPVHITFENLSAGRVWVVLVRLDSGRSVEEFEDWTDTAPGAGLPGFVTTRWTTGDRNGIDASRSVAEETELVAGTYAMACGSVAPDLGYFASGLEVEG